MEHIVKIAKGPAVPLLVIALSCMSWMGLHGSHTARETRQAAAAGSFFVEPFELTTSETVPDWATQADYVVNAEVVGEQRVEPDDPAAFARDGFELVGRTVSLSVTDVVWRSSTTALPDPTTFSMDAFGWMRNADGTEQELAVAGASRLEVGHQYVLALKWREAACAKGDADVPAHWSVLGSAGALPADSETIGVGELEGSDVNLVEDPSEAPVAADSALAEFVGDQPAAMEQALDRAESAPAPAAARKPQQPKSHCG